MPRSHISDTAWRQSFTILRSSTTVVFQNRQGYPKGKRTVTFETIKENESWERNSVGYNAKEKSVEPKQVSVQSPTVFIQKQSTDEMKSSVNRSAF